MKIIFASANVGKIREIKAILAGTGITVQSMKDAGFTGSLPEDGSTYHDNARQKAETLYSQLGSLESGTLVLADDSGLEVDALSGRPGVFSARYGGDGAKDKDKIDKLLGELAGVKMENRTARFRCVMACVMPGRRFITEGACEGRIGLEAKGTYGFGYDPVFLTENSGYSKSMAEEEESVKNIISHRGRAMAAMLQLLREAGVLS